jgi:hypothetical protein
MTWAERDRFAERTMVERVSSRLKYELGFRSAVSAEPQRSWRTLCSACRR